MICIGIVSLLSLPTYAQNPTMVQECKTTSFLLYLSNTVENIWKITLFLPSGYTRRGDEFTLGDWCQTDTEIIVPLIPQDISNQQPNTHTIQVKYTGQGSSPIGCIINTPFAVPYIATISSTTSSPSYSKSYEGVIGLHPTLGSSPSPNQYITYIRNIRFMRDVTLAQMVQFEFSGGSAGVNSALEIKLMKSDGTFITTNHGCTSTVQQNPIIKCTQAFESYVDAIVITFPTKFGLLTPILVDPSTTLPYGHAKLGCRWNSLSGTHPTLEYIQEVQEPKIPLPPTMIS